MENDVSPKLLNRIQSAFDRNLYENEKAASLLNKINAGNGTYADAGNYAEQVGNSLSKALQSELKPSALPDGKMYWHIAEDAVKPMYEQEYKLATDAATTVQNSLNRKAKIGLKAKTAELDEDTLKSIMDMYCAADYTESNDVLYETPETYARSGVDNTLKENAEFQYQCGRDPKIIRRAGAKCCPWCADREGTYDYPNVPDDVYKRHDYCKCSIDYDPGGTERKTQDVWSKRWVPEDEAEKVEERKTYNIQRTYDSEGLKIKESSRRKSSVNKERLRTLNL